MNALITTIFCVGSLVTFVGTIMFLVAAFRQSVLWGLAVLFLPFANIVFLIKYWYEAKKAFFIQLIGVGISIIGIIVGAAVGARAIASTIKSGDIPICSEFGIKQPGKKTVKTITKQSPVQQNHIIIPSRKNKRVAKKPVASKSGDSTEDNFVGMNMEEAKRMLGKPMGVIESGGKMIYRYKNIELVSKDGITVTSQSRY